MIDRLVICNTDPLVIQNEISLLRNKYKGTVLSSEEDPTEVVFKLRNKHIFTYHLTTMTNDLDTGILLNSFKQIEELNLLVSLGLSEKEIKELLNT